MNTSKSLIEIRTGSDSDMPKIQAAYDLLNQLGIAFSPRILSAHRTPERMADEARKLAQNGFRACIAAAGGSAHLPGMTASETSVPVIGLPVYSSTFRGIDALYSIIQMPEGIPVGTVAPGDAAGAALFAAQTACLDLPETRRKIRALLQLEKPLPENLALKPLVGMVRHPDCTADKTQTAGMLALLNDFGMSCIELNHDNELPENIYKLEQAGAIALISVGNFNRAPARFDYPGTGITDLPVIGLPVTDDELLNYSGDIGIASLLFAQQALQTRRTPMALMGVNRTVNAALYASQIAGLYHPHIREKFESYRKKLAEAVVEKDEHLQKSAIPAN